MSRIILTSISVLLFVLSSCACLANQQTERTETQASPSIAPTPSPSPLQKPENEKSTGRASLGGGLYIVPTDIDETNNRLHYEIGIAYPKITGSGKPQVLGFNRLAASIAKREASLYRRTQFGPREKLPPWWKDSEEYLSMTYDVIFANDAVVSIRFDLQTYTRGSAHAVQQFRVINYDLEHGKQLQLGDLFTPNSQYLNFIADYCLSSLRELNRSDCLEAAKRPGSGIDRDYCQRVANNDFWLPEYARPISNNFQFWSLTKDGLLLSFEECRMAACAARPREVTIPYDKLKNIANPNSVLSQQTALSTK
jgi:hypothetical protein